MRSANNETHDIWFVNPNCTTFAKTLGNNNLAAKFFYLHTKKHLIFLPLKIFNFSSVFSEAKKIALNFN